MSERDYRYQWSQFRSTGMQAPDVRAVCKRIDEVCESWVGTPHRAGQRAKGLGVDCVQFVCAALDELAGLPLGTTRIPRLSQDTGASDPNFVHGLPVARGILRVHPAEAVQGPEVQPGDVIVCRLGSSGGPGHVALVAGTKGRAYHADMGAGKVCWTSVASLSTAIHAWRVDSRTKWGG